MDLDLLRSGPPVLELVAPDGEVVTVERGHFDDRGNGNVTWTGRVAGNSYESVLLVLEDGHLVGSYERPDGQRYGVRAGSDGRGHVSTPPPEGVEAAHVADSHEHTHEHDHTDEHPEWCAVRSPPVPPVEGQPVERGAGASEPPRALEAGSIRVAPGAQTTPVTIKVLVLYSQGAALRLGAGRDAFLRGAIAHANMVFRNNGLNAIYEAAYEPMPVATELHYERSSLDWIDLVQYDRHARELRSVHRADLVSVWGLTSSSVLCGLGWTRNRTASDAGVPQSNASFWEYGVSENNLGCSQDDWGYWMTFTHELGHNLGGQHERAITLAEHAFWALTAAFGYVDSTGFPSQRARHTIMAYGPRNTAPGSTRIPWFSHPATFLYQGRAVTAGATGSADVESVAEITIPLTAQLSDHVPPASPTLNAPAATVVNSELGIYLSWTDRSPNEHGFSVELRTSGGGGGVIGAKSPSSRPT